MMHLPRLFPIPGAALVLALAGCSGQIEGVGDAPGGTGGRGSPPRGSTTTPPAVTPPAGSPTGEEPPPATPPVALPAGAAKPGPAVLRRLTAREYRSTVTALLGLGAAPTGTLEPDPRSKAGFDNFAAELMVSPTGAGLYADLAASLARAFQPPACAAAAEPECAKTFIATFGKRAFRRPLTPAEAQRYQALYTDERARSSHAGAIGQVVETLLQSPKFLYRSELGIAAGGNLRKLTAYEIASELSYMFTGSMPDDALFAAADANQLQTPAQVAAQARRLMALPAARGAIRELLLAYAGLGRFDELVKSAEVYPAFTPALHAAMLQETSRFVDGVLWDEDGTFKTLMTAPYSYVDAGLAKLYGAPAPAGTALVKTNLNAAQRSGLLTQAAVLSAHAKADESFPILRGKFIRVGLLCHALPAPPAVVPPAPVPVRTATTRERFAQHASDPACAGCHALIDPLGFGLESYDGIGRYRETENGKPVDASGTVTGTSDADGPYRGGVELARRLAASTDARQCFALHAYRWAFGRYDGPGERALVDAIEKALAPAGMDIREVLVAITASPSFTTRTFE